MGTEWIVLMRHAEAWYSDMPEEKRSPEHPDLTITGADSASYVSRRFSQFLADTRCPGGVVVYDVDTSQSEETADIVRHELGTLAIGNTASVECLSPKNLPTYGIHSETVETASDPDDIPRRRQSGNPPAHAALTRVGRVRDCDVWSRSGYGRWKRAGNLPRPH